MSSMDRDQIVRQLTRFNALVRRLYREKQQYYNILQERLDYIGLEFSKIIEMYDMTNAELQAIDDTDNYHDDDDDDDGDGDGDEDEEDAEDHQSDGEDGGDNNNDGDHDRDRDGDRDRDRDSVANSNGIVDDDVDANTDWYIEWYPPISNEHKEEAASGAPMEPPKKKRATSAHQRAPLMEHQTGLELLANNPLIVSDKGEGVAFFVDIGGAPQIYSRPKIKLSDALREYNSGFIKRAEDRQRRIANAQHYRAQLGAERRNIAEGLLEKRVSLQEAWPKLCTDQGDIRAFSPTEMAKITKRHLQNSEELMKKKAQENAQRDQQANRLLSYCYSQAIRAKKPPPTAAQVFPMRVCNRPSTSGVGSSAASAANRH